MKRMEPKFNLLGHRFFSAGVTSQGGEKKTIIQISRLTFDPLFIENECTVVCIKCFKVFNTAMFSLTLVGI